MTISFLSLSEMLEWADDQGWSVSIA